MKHINLKLQWITTSQDFILAKRSTLDFSLGQTMAPVNMTHNWFLLSGPWSAYWKRLQFFFPYISYTKDQVKVVREELVKFMTFQMLTNMFRERDLCQIVFGYGLSKSQLLTQEPTIPLKKQYIYYTNFIFAALFFVCTMGQSSTTTFF